MYRYSGKNYRPFTAICDCRFGRRIIYTNQDAITQENILDELAKALPLHEANAAEIEYLDRYYRGDQPILYRKKDIRPEVNNKVVENLAMFIVDTKTSEMVGEPIQYVLRSTDKTKSEEVSKLNAIMENEDKSYHDIELCRWRSICGTGYRYVGKKEGEDARPNEPSFYLSTEHPAYTFVVYFERSGKPAFSCQIGKTNNNRIEYFCFTKSFWFRIVDWEIEEFGINGNGAIPVIEYPNNARRISDIEISISITDNINVMASDRANGIEQHVSSWIKFINCTVDEDSFRKMRHEGALVVKSSGSDVKADVDILSNELVQSESQIAVNDLFEKLLIIHGLADRQTNTGGDTGSAVTLRNGFYSMEKRSELSEPILKKAERDMLRIVLNRLRVDEVLTLQPVDIEIKISRTKSDNMQLKAQVLQMLLQSGINPERAIKTIGLFADPEQVAIESQKRMEMLYPENENINQSFVKT